MNDSKIWRLVLECAHSRISGPWHADEPDDKHMIGDITFCEVCPMVPRAHGLSGEMRLRQVVDVERVPAANYREPGGEVARRRMDTLRA